MPLCFAIMPISMPPERLGDYNEQHDHFLNVAEHLFQPAAEAAGYEFRAPAATHAELIQAGIIENLWQADLVLCDISTWNPNVFYEFGIRCALNKPVAMVKDNKTERIPFDTVMVNCHTYSADLSVMTVKREIPKLTTFLEAAKPQTENTVWKYFGIKESAERPQPENPEDAKLDLLLAEIAAVRDRTDQLHRAYKAQQKSSATSLPRDSLSDPDVGWLQTRKDRAINGVIDQLLISTNSEGFHRSEVPYETQLRDNGRTLSVLTDIPYAIGGPLLEEATRGVKNILPDVKTIEFVDGHTLKTYAVKLV